MKNINFLILALTAISIISCSTMNQSPANDTIKNNTNLILNNNGVILNNYYSVGTVYASPMHISDISFESGEKILDTNIGDNARWVVSSAKSGKEPNLVEHIIVKPILNNIKTNMIVITDKGRTYNFNLISNESGYGSIYGFYY